MFLVQVFIKLVLMKPRKVEKHKIPNFEITPFSCFLNYFQYFVVSAGIQVTTIPSTAPALHVEASALAIRMKSVEDGGKFVYI